MGMQQSCALRAMSPMVETAKRMPASSVVLDLRGVVLDELVDVVVAVLDKRQVRAVHRVVHQRASRGSEPRREVGAVGVVRRELVVVEDAARSRGGDNPREDDVPHEEVVHRRGGRADVQQVPEHPLGRRHREEQVVRRAVALRRGDLPSVVPPGDVAALAVGPAARKGGLVGLSPAGSPGCTAGEREGGRVGGDAARRSYSQGSQPAGRGGAADGGFTGAHVDEEGAGHTVDAGGRRLRVKV